MKNILLFLIGAFTCLQSFAQDPDPDLFQTWYLTSISTEGSDDIIVSNVSPPIHPTFTITEFLDFSGIVCNEYGGFFTFDAVNDQLFLDDFSPCLCGTCNNPPPSHVNVEDQYFGTFVLGTNYSYTISDGTQGDKILTLSSQIFDVLVYSNTFLGVSNQKVGAVSIFPNPASEVLFITSENTSIEKVTVYSNIGNKVIEISSDLNSIDISSLVSGLYFLEISSSEGIRFQKFIKH